MTTDPTTTQRPSARNGFVVAGTHSGVGKTTIALGLMAALKARGLNVAPFKVGPDFIDPGHHAVATGNQSRNLDGWMLDRETNMTCFQTHAATADVAVIEGVMGLFDGYSGQDDAGSTAQMARWLNLPVLLVVSAASMARSAAAVVQGFERFDPRLRFAGVVFNHLGSSRHLTYVRDATIAHAGMPVLGGVLRDARLALSKRHLGLVTAEDHTLSPVDLDRLAQTMEAHLDIEALLAGLPPIEPPLSAVSDTPSEERPSKVRIGVARDRAFCFYYPDNLDRLAAAGAELVPFSPLTDMRLPEDLDGLYIGGGYPELHATRLAQNANLRAAIRQCSRKGMPIYAECGGFMYLCRHLVDQTGQRHPMCACFPLETRMFDRRKRLGYREVRLARETLLGKAGTTLRGHEFHYSDLIQPPPQTLETVYAVSPRRGGQPRPEGYQVNRTLGSYIHLHLGSRPEAAAAVVAHCRSFRHAKEDSHATP